MQALIQQLISAGHDLKFDTVTQTTTVVTSAGSSSSSHAPSPVILPSGQVEAQVISHPSSNANVKVISTPPVIVDGTMPVHISKRGAADRMARRYSPAGKRRL